MNALKNTLLAKRNKLLSVFFTAGYPNLDNTADIILSLQENDVDFVEVGMPYSDPLADGPVIQHSNMVAIQHGMTMSLLFEQLKAIKHQVRIPLILMGYLNPVLQFGAEAFCKNAYECGVSGVILPDLPLTEFENHYAALFRKYNLHAIFLVTPTSSPERIRKIDALSEAFIYAVSASSITGAQPSDTAPMAENPNKAHYEKQQYFLRLQSMHLKHPVIAGFGIYDRQTLSDAWEYTSGAILGTAYLKLLGNGYKPADAIVMLRKQIGAS